MDRHGLHENDLEVIGAQMLTDLQQVQQLFAKAADTDRAASPVGR